MSDHHFACSLTVAHKPGLMIQLILSFENDSGLLNESQRSTLWIPQGIVSLRNSKIIRTQKKFSGKLSAHVLYSTWSLRKFPEARTRRRCRIRRNFLSLLCVRDNSTTMRRISKFKFSGANWFHRQNF